VRTSCARRPTPSSTPTSTGDSSGTTKTKPGPRRTIRKRPTQPCHGFPTTREPRSGRRGARHPLRQRSRTDAPPHPRIINAQTRREEDGRPTIPNYREKRPRRRHPRKRAAPQMMMISSLAKLTDVSLPSATSTSFHDIPHPTMADRTPHDARMPLQRPLAHHRPTILDDTRRRSSTGKPTPTPAAPAVSHPTTLFTSRKATDASRPLVTPHPQHSLPRSATIRGGGWRTVMALQPITAALPWMTHNAACAEGRGDADIHDGSATARRTTHARRLGQIPNRVETARRSSDYGGARRDSRQSSLRARQDLRLPQRRPTHRSRPRHLPHHLPRHSPPRRTDNSSRRVVRLARTTLQRPPTTSSPTPATGDTVH
jgi:hypothetical protein